MWKSTLTHLRQPDREKITQFRDDGMTMAAIAKRFGVSVATISRSLDKRTALDKDPPTHAPASD
jgi:IS30 family transposase